MCYSQTVSLSQLLKDFSCEESQWLLDTFRCEKNVDIERFLRQSAIRFEQARLARTYFLQNENAEILAYFTLSFKSIRVKASKSQLKKLTGGLTETEQINVFLIAQIGKNSDIPNNPVTLQQIFDNVLEQLLVAQRAIGGRVAILECEDNVKLMQLYENHGFRVIETVEDASQLKTMFIIPKLD